MIRRPPRSTLDRSSAASDVYKRQAVLGSTTILAPQRAAARPLGCGSPTARVDCAPMDAADSLRYGWRRTNRGLVPGGISMSVYSLFRAVVGATILAALLPVSAAHSQELGDEAVVRLVAVSYTHLTLPTSGLGVISVVAVSLKKKKRSVTVVDVLLISHTARA